MSFTESVKAEARRLGFKLVGVTRPAPPPHLKIFFDWLKAGRHGEMSYLATDLARRHRADPCRVLPECLSILVLGMRYPSPDAAPLLENLNTFGRVSSYAWGTDYHDVISERLESLVVFIEKQIGNTVSNRWYTDTGPILERDLAQRAGLGWIGKNTCLINPKQGSFFLLAEVLLGVELDVDTPFVQDRCGTCTRCLEACPTSCILSDRTIDATRCISYLTIELKGPISHDLRSQIGDWVFGCDVCQQVCPWNQRFTAPECVSEFSPRPKVPFPELLEEINLSPEAFNHKFRDSPVKRAKRRGYLRNVAVALGNMAASHGASIDESVVPALSRVLLSEHEPLVRGHTAWALGQIGTEAALQALTEALQAETDIYVLEETHTALGR